MGSPLPLPSPSPSSPRPAIKHEVFLSFRGEDIRYNFLSHLYKVFRDNKINAFIDDQLERGQEISPALLQAIKESQISVVIFSENYADSTWCLEELVKILECKQKNGQIVIPVFYQINPSDVRKQTGSYAVAFEKHKDRFKEDLDKVQKWRDDLREAANISGFASSDVKDEAALVENIVGDVLKKLSNMPSSENDTPSSDNMQQVGMKSKIRKIEKMLRMGDQMNVVHKVGICGIGGIGKTTLAKAVFDEIYCQFPEGHFFIGSVREASEKKELNLLKQELYPEKLRGGNAYGYYPYIKKRLRPRKLLIVFDDVTTFQQIKYLIGDLDHCLESGSRIIITSRDRQVLRNCQVNKNDIYMVEELHFDDSLKLFNWHAFKPNPPEADYMELSKAVVKKVRGVPLALKVLGCFLLGKRKEVWENSMKKLENFPDNEIYEVLKISYDGLDHYQKRVFLDIACCYKGWDVKLVIAIMHASDSYPYNDLSALEDKCLIIIVDNRLMMHDLLQAMGKRIVREASEDPGKRTWLFNHNDIYDVLTKPTETTKIEGISLDMSNIGDINLHPDAFEKMPHLRILQLYISDYSRDNNNKMHVSENFKFLLTKLRYLHWERCPLKSLQSNLYFENLVILKLRDSNVEQLWSDEQQFHNLKYIDLHGCKKLIRLPELKAPKLEHLNLNGCASLIKMPPSFEHLSQLRFLTLSSDHYFRRFSGCSQLQRLPELSNNLEELYLNGCSSLIEIPSFIQHLTRLHFLYLSDCPRITSFADCTSLQRVVISHCSKLKRLPGSSDKLRQIHLEGRTSLFENLSSFQYADKLRSWTLKDCESLIDLPDLMDWESLKRLNIHNCSKLQGLPELPKNLEEIAITRCSSLIKIPLSIEHLSRLCKLNLSDCSKLERLPELPKNLEEIAITKCSSLIKIPSSIEHLSRLCKLNLSDCSKLERLPELPNNLKEIDVRKCSSLIEIPSSIEHLSRLCKLNLSNCKKLERLPELPNNNNLEEIDLSGCSSMREIPSSIQYLTRLPSWDLISGYRHEYSRSHWFDRPTPATSSSFRLLKTQKAFKNSQKT